MPDQRRHLHVTNLPLHGEDARCPSSSYWICHPSRQTVYGRLRPPFLLHSGPSLEPWCLGLRKPRRALVPCRCAIATRQLATSSGSKRSRLLRRTPNRPRNDMAMLRVCPGCRGLLCPTSAQAGRVAGLCVVNSTLRRHSCGCGSRDQDNATTLRPFCVCCLVATLALRGTWKQPWWLYR